MTDWNIIEYKEVDSTNDIAKSMLLDGTNIDKTIIISECQKKGRGQGNNKWYSDNKNGIYFSMILRPNISLSKLEGLSIKTGEILKEFLELRFKGINLTVKPPNDIMAENRKLSGILIESINVGQETRGIIIGIGLNVSHRKLDFPEELRETAISLSELCGKDIYDRKEIVKDFIPFFEKQFGEYLDDLQKL